MKAAAISQGSFLTSPGVYPPCSPIPDAPHHNASLQLHNYSLNLTA